MLSLYGAIFVPYLHLRYLTWGHLCNSFFNNEICQYLFFTMFKRANLEIYLYKYYILLYAGAIHYKSRNQTRKNMLLGRLSS